MDEKKKLIVVGVLVAVIACVGAFQFLGGSSPAPAPVVAESKPKTDSTAADKAKDAPPALKNPALAGDLPQRDPFSAPADAQPITKMPIAHPAPFPTVRRHPSVDNKMAMAINPLPGAVSDLKTMPPASVATHPEKVLDEKPFSYRVVGTIGGVRPEVMVEDSSGNQKLVPVGSAIDSDARVRGVENGAVTIEYRGKKLRLTVGGNPGGK